MVYGYMIAFMTVKVAEKNDFGALAAISLASMSEPWSVADFVAASENPFAIVLAAEDENGPAGYAVGYFAADEAELPSIAVKASCRGRGIGSRLLSELSDAVREKGASKLFLEVRESNEAALALYQKNGFITAGVRKRFYRDPDEDAFVMMRLL